MDNKENTQMEPFVESGVLLVDKPLGWTSHDVIAFLKGRFRIAKIGHAGTLDPAATGLLVVLIGKATKLSNQLTGHDKVYEAELLLGQETDSYDMDGDVTSSKGCVGITFEKVTMVISTYVGDLLQVPPMFSAKKINGKKLYELAREGKTIARAAVPIRINALKMNVFDPPVLSFVVECSKGTYIRSLAHDIGADLGCGATLSKLTRLKSGEYELKNSVNIEHLREFTQNDLGSVLIKMHEAIPTSTF